MAGVRRYQDLDCWKLANELKLGVYEIIERSPAKHDFDFRDQLRDAASSGPSNISEAFGYYRHPDAARFVRIAKSSLTETHHHLGDGVDRNYWKADEAVPLLPLRSVRSVPPRAGFATWKRRKHPNRTGKKQEQQLPENAGLGSKHGST